MHSLVIHQVCKSFGRHEFLKDISFECETGEILGVFGRNGCGKSTLLKIIFGTLSAKITDVSIDGKKMIPKNNINEGHVSYVPQHDFLPKNMKVREVIPLYCQKGDDQDQIFYAPGIAKIEKKRISTLSMGELRYFELLLVASLQHPFMMLDEPFSMIDPLNKELISELLINLKKKKGIIITDHYYEDVLRISDKNILIKDGNVIQINGEKDLINEGYLKSSDF